MIVRSQMVCLTLLSSLFAGTADASGETIRLSTRTRSERAPDSGQYHAKTVPLEWDAAKTAVVICDMWDKHWCPQSTTRVGEMAPRMNEVVKAARRKGMLIIHCPSDTLEFYKDTPQRKLAQSAPKVETQIPLKGWCHLDEKLESALPIDDSDGGCDCATPVRNYRAWSRQHPAIEIKKPDAITDSAEAFYLMKQRGITNVIVMGVHTNMCVLGRPFSIRQMVQQGQNVVLMRDMTDTMYNPQMAPYVSHFTGTDLIVEHIEKFWCPTVLSTDLTGEPEFRFRNDERKHLVVLCAEREYRTNESLPKFAAQQLGHDFRVSFVWDDVDDPNRLPGIDVVADADILLVSVRRRTLPPEQLKYVTDFVAAGKPVVGIRTASHAFNLRNKPAPEGLADWPKFDSEVFGGNYTNHHGAGPKTVLTPAVANANPARKFLQGLTGDFSGRGSLYMVSPLAPSATPLIYGKVPDKDAEPVAWLNRRKDGGTSLYTSLGHIDDFSQPGFVAFLRHAIVSLTN